MSETQVTYPTYETNTVVGTKMAGTLKVRALTVEDVKKATGLSTVAPGPYLGDASYQDLFDTGAYYWLASGYIGYGLLCVESTGSVRGSNGMTAGIRPVVSLKANIKAICRDVSNTWKIGI